MVQQWLLSCGREVSAATFKGLLLAVQRQLQHRPTTAGGSLDRMMAGWRFPGHQEASLKLVHMRLLDVINTMVDLALCGLGWRGCAHSSRACRALLGSCSLQLHAQYLRAVGHLHAAA
jgi:hypothetical protein